MLIHIEGVFSNTDKIKIPCYDIDQYHQSLLSFHTTWATQIHWFPKYTSEVDLISTNISAGIGDLPCSLLFSMIPSRI